MFPAYSIVQISPAFGERTTPHGCNRCDHNATLRRGKYRRLLSIAVAMFAIGVVGASLTSDSVSLLADLIDFLGDYANYGLSLFVLGMSVTVRAKASLQKRFRCCSSDSEY